MLVKKFWYKLLHFFSHIYAANYGKTVGNYVQNVGGTSEHAVAWGRDFRLWKMTISKASALSTTGYVSMRKYLNFLFR
jgi:hypothetical protein